MKFGRFTMEILQEIKDRLEISTHEHYGDFTYQADVIEHIEEINKIISELSTLNAPKSLALFKEVKALLLEIDEYTFESLDVINSALNELKLLNGINIQTLNVTKFIVLASVVINASDEYSSINDIFCGVVFATNKDEALKIAKEKFDYNFLQNKCSMCERYDIDYEVKEINEI